MGWIKRIQQWIAQLFKPKRRTFRPRILKRWYGEYCAVSRLERDTQGETSTYRITPLFGDCDYLLALDYLPVLQAEMVGELNGTPFRLRPLAHPHNAALTHRFSVWRVYSNGSSSVVGIWDCDLQGVTKGALSELAPKRAIAAVALRTLKIAHSTKTPTLSWHSQIERMDWLGLLQERIREELSNPHHNIKACIWHSEKSYRKYKNDQTAITWSGINQRI